jgi:hypothetical protein
MLVTAIFRTGKANLPKAFFIICAVTSFNDAVAPGTRFFDQRMDPPIFFNGPGEGRLAFGMRCVFHREGHCVIRKRDEKRWQVIQRALIDPRQRFALLIGVNL